MTIQEFIDKYNIRLEIRSVKQNPYNNSDSDWSGKANHYECTFYMPGNKQFITYFSQGTGIQGYPKSDSVLDCLLSDSDCLDYNFKDWCDNLGYDNDSIKAKENYDLCVRISTKLKLFLGEKLFNELYQCERL